MNTDLEKFIRQWRKDFDDESPSEKAWENIERYLPANKHAKLFTIRDIYKWSAVAAVFFIVLTSAYFLFIREYSHETSKTKTESPDNSSPFDNFNLIAIKYAEEFKQASQAVENRQKELKTATAAYPELYRRFQNDLNVLDSSYRMLREQANQSVNRDVIIKAMIQNLQLQSELLGRQLLIIHDVKTTKTSKNEKGT